MVKFLIYTILSFFFFSFFFFSVSPRLEGGLEALSKVCNL